MAKKLTITWVRSTIGLNRTQLRTIKGLGLHKLNDTVVQEDSRPILGMINKVKHLVRVEEQNS